MKKNEKKVWVKIPAETNYFSKKIWSQTVFLKGKQIMSLFKTLKRGILPTNAKYP